MFDYETIAFIAQHPGAGGIRFSIPKRNKMQQNAGNFNHQGQGPNFENKQRFYSPSGPRHRFHSNMPNPPPEPNIPQNKPPTNKEQPKDLTE